MQDIQGLTPGMLWDFARALVLILLLFVALEKVPDIWWKWRDRKKKAQAEADGTAQEPVKGIQTRLDAIENRLAEIDGKLDRDKRRLDALEDKTDEIQEGFQAICSAMLALLKHAQHDGGGDSVEVEEAQKGLEDYLITKKRTRRYDA